MQRRDHTFDQYGNPRRVTLAWNSFAQRGQRNWPRLLKLMTTHTSNANPQYAAASPYENDGANTSTNHTASTDAKSTTQKARRCVR
jgi:hypothetical protein